MERKKLEELRSLLIVVDMVNGFVRRGNMADPYIEHIIPEQLNLIKTFLEHDGGISFIKDTHEKDCLEFNRFPLHCLKGTEEAELVEELKPYEKDALVFEKNSTSTMYAPGFISTIEQMKNLRKIIVTGCCTDICVTNLSIPLRNYLDEINRDVEIIVPTNAVETYNSDTHNRDEYNEIAFKLMNQSGITLVKKLEMRNIYGK